MLLQLQKHLQTELRPFQVRSHVTQKLGQISKICSVQKLDIEILFRSFRISGHLPALINKKDGYRQQNVRQRQKLISIIDYEVCMTFY